MASTTIPPALPWLVRRGALAVWHELPKALAAGALTLASAVPLGVAVGSGAPRWLAAVTVVVPALALTGLARFAAGLLGPERVTLRALGQPDPVLAGSLAAAGWVAALLPAWAGALAGALLLLVAPMAVAYGAVRGRTGLAALRGGLVLVAYRPVWALTVLALGVLLGFAAIASVGVLAVVALPLLCAIAAAVVTGLLDDIDAQPRGRA
jgi:hypothetical protein